jgi:heat shock protein HtpX
MATLKTTILLGLLTALVIGIGYFVGGQQGALIGLVLSAIMNFGSYWFSDKFVLSLYGATAISETENPQLHRIVAELAESAAIPKPRLYLVNLPVPNAFATGRNENNAVVAVTSGLLTLLNEEELRGVIAHELSHVKNRDILVSTIAATLAGAVSYIAQMAYWGSAFSSRDDEGGGSMLSMMVLLILTPIIATLLHLAVSRSREYLADETGARVSKDPRSLASALKKLHGFAGTHPLVGEPKYEATAHLFIVNPFKPSILMSLFSTHPPVLERIRRLEQYTP